MTNSIETSNQKLNPELNSQHEKYWEFKNVLEQKFSDKFSWKDLSEYLNRDLNNIEKNLINHFFKIEGEHILSIKLQCEKEDITFWEIEDLLSMSNIDMIPDSVKEELNNKLHDILKQEISEIDSSFLDKSQLESFLNESSIDNRVATLKKYLSFFQQIDTKQKNAIKEYVNGTNESIKDLSTHSITTLGEFTTVLNYAQHNIIPAQTLAKYNQITADAIKNGLLNPMHLTIYLQSEEWLRGIGKKVAKLVETWNTNSDNESLDEISQELSLLWNSFPWMDKYADFHQKYWELMTKISWHWEITNTDIQNQYKMRSELAQLLINIQKEHNYIPHEYLVLQDKLEKIGMSIILEKPTNAPETLHMRKMVNFLDMCSNWMQYEGDYEADKIEAIKTVQQEILSGKIKSFSELESNTIFIESDAEDVLQNYWNYLKDSVILDEDGMDEMALELDVSNEWIFHDNISVLDEILEKFDGWEIMNLSRLNQAQAIDMISLGASKKELVLGFIEWDLVEELRKKNVSESSFTPSQEQIKAKVTNLDQEINRDMFLSELSKMSRAQKEQIILSKEETIPTNNRQLDLKVLEIIKADVLNQTAYRSLRHEKIIELTKNWNLLDGRMKEFMDTYNDSMNDFLSSAYDITTMLLKEAIIFVATSIITAWVGGFATTFARMSWSLMLTYDNTKTIWKVISVTANNKLTKGISKIWKFTVARTFETFNYTAFSAMMYEGEQMTVDNFVTNFGMFTGWVLWAKIGGNFIKAWSAEWKNIAKQSFGWAVWATGANMLTLVTYHGEEVSLQEAWNMAAQWILMWGLMLPMMRAWIKPGQKAGEWWANKANGIANRVKTSKINKLKSQTQWVAEHINIERAWLQQILEGTRKALNITPKLTTQQQRIDYYTWLQQQYTMLSRMYNNSLPKYNQKITKLQNEINKGQPTYTKSELKIKRSELKDALKWKNNVIQTIHKLDTKLTQFKDANWHVDLTKIAQIWEFAPIQRARIETMWALKSQQLWIREFVNNSRVAKLEALQKIDASAKYNSLGNGFTLKNGTEIVDRNNSTIAILPKDVSINSIQYLNIWKHRIPTLNLSNGKILRLHDMHLWQHTNIGKNLVEKTANEWWHLEVLLNNKNVIKWYKYTSENWKTEAYKINWNKVNWDKIAEFEANTTKTTLSNSWKITLSELQSKYKIDTQANKLKTKWDKELDKVMSDDVMIKMRKSNVDALNNAAKDPNISPAEKSKLLTAATKIGKMPISLFKNILKKWFITTWLLGGWVLAVDYMNDWDIDIWAIWTGIAILAWTSDVWLEMFSKIPFAGKMFTKLKDLWWKHKTTAMIIRLWLAIVAMDYVDDQNSPNK